MSITSDSCLYYNNVNNLSEIDICDPYKLDCYLANPYLCFWTSAYLNGYSDVSGTHPPGDINAYHATIDYLGRYFDQFISYIVFYNKMQFESQNINNVSYEIGWYCRYTADNYGNYFNTESAFSYKDGNIFDPTTPPIPTVKKFCGGMCCYRKAYNLKGWFWQNMQLALRFFTEGVRYENLPISRRIWRCEVTLPQKIITINSANTSSSVANVSLVLLEYKAPGPSILYSTIVNSAYIKNCMCFTCCVYDETITPVAPWVLNANLNKDIMKYIYSPVITCGDGTCDGIPPCPSGCANSTASVANCIYP